jgi:hypothetical protein
MQHRYEEVNLVNGYTVTAENKLYCELKGQRQAIQTMFGVGAVLGVLLVNLVSDYRGRKFSLMQSQIC